MPAAKRISPGTRVLYPAVRKRAQVVYLVRFREPGISAWTWAKTIFLHRSDAQDFEARSLAHYDSSTVRRDIAELSRVELSWPVYPFEVSERISIEV